MVDTVILLLLLALTAPAKKAKRTPPPVAVEQKTEPTPTPAQKPVVVTDKKAAPFIELHLGVDGGMRSFTIVDDLFGRFSRYDNPFVPVVNGRAAYHPGAHVSSGVASWFGAVLQGGVGFAGSGRDEVTGSVVSTSVWHLGFGVRARAKLGPVTFALYGLAEHRVFDFAGNLPNMVGVRTWSLVPALEMRVDLPKGFFVQGRGGYEGVLDPGVTRLFPRAAAYGFHAEVGAGHLFPFGLMFTAGVAYRHVAYDFRVQPGDRHLAGGALDQQLMGRVGLGFER